MDGIDNLIAELPDQFTQRQIFCLEEVLSRAIFFKDSDFMGMHEFRFEGAGNYRGGKSDDGYNDSKVSGVSIDFKNLNGHHNDGQPSSFNDGFGLYGAMSIVVKKCDVLK